MSECTRLDFVTQIFKFLPDQLEDFTFATASATSDDSASIFDDFICHLLLPCVVFIACTDARLLDDLAPDPFVFEPCSEIPVAVRVRIESLLLLVFFVLVFVVLLAIVWHPARVSLLNLILFQFDMG